MLRLGDKVIVVMDSLEQNLPIGEYGYIIAYDRNADNIFDYVVRIPKINKHVFVPAEDIELESILLEQEAERIEREALLDYALATRNEELFRQLMGQSQEEDAAEPEQANESMSAEDFIKQVNLKAWI